MPLFAIIGASRGVGLELARQLSANHQNTVVVTVRDKAKTPYVKALEQERDGNLHIIQADVLDTRAMEHAAYETGKITGGKIDVLIHNAARMERSNMVKGLLDYEAPEQLDAEFMASFDVNVLGVIRSVNAFLPLLRKGAQKKIVIIGSEGGDCDMVWKARLSKVAAYGVTKAAENMVAIKYAAELEGEGFSVASISPGMVDVSGTATEPMVTEELIPTVTKIMGGIQAAYPKAASISPEESGRRLIGFIESLSPAQSGAFFRSPEFV